MARLAAGRRLAAGVVGAAALGGVAGLGGRLAATRGATSAETTADLPGDDLVAGRVVATTRATTLPGPPAAVWPWLVQLGWGRAGWYSLDAVEAAVGVARSTAADGTTSWRSLREVVPAHQQLAVGDVVPLSATTGFTVAALAPRRHLVLHLAVGGVGWGFDWSWAWVLRPDPAGTRLLVRTRVAGRPWPLALPLLHAVVDPGHAVMELVQLHNLRRRVATHPDPADVNAMRHPRRAGLTPAQRHADVNAMRHPRRAGLTPAERSRAVTPQDGGRA